MRISSDFIVVLAFMLCSYLTDVVQASVPIATVSHAVIGTLLNSVSAQAVHPARVLHHIDETQDSIDIVNVEEIRIVSNGRINKDTALSVGLKGQPLNEAIECKGENNYILVRQSFTPGSFKVTARISLNQINGTGASFLFDNNMLIFDCPESSFCDTNKSVCFWGRELTGDGIRNTTRNKTRKL